MRLWHEKCFEHMSKQRIQGQHRECCALRGRGWMKPHSTVNYIFKYPIEFLVAYHLKLIECAENKHRVNIAEPWKDITYRGKKKEPLIQVDKLLMHRINQSDFIYSEHDEPMFLSDMTDLYFRDDLNKEENKNGST